MNPAEIMAHMEEKTRREVLAEMRPASELVVLAGRGAEEMRVDLEQWKAGDRVFSTEHEGIEYFPPFALDPGAGYRPYPAVAAVLRILRELRCEGSWGPAGWFVGVNSFLDDQRPMDLLAEDPEWMIEAARDTVGTEKHAHGCPGNCGQADPGPPRSKREITGCRPKLRNVRINTPEHRRGELRWARKKVHRP